MSEHRRQRIITRFIALSLAGMLVALDQLTKWLVSQDRSIFKVIPGFFNIVYVENTGAAFGILQGRQYLLMIVGILALGILLVLILFDRDEKQSMRYALALIFAGTCGNLIDRIRVGYVIDFLQFHIKHYYWPSFNIADTVITTGVGILILLTLLQSHSAPDQNPQEYSSQP